MHLEIRSATEIVTDTILVGGGEAMTRPLDPGLYTYTVVSESGVTVGAGRFDVSGVSLEMLPVAKMPELSSRRLGLPGNTEDSGRPLRTYPWVYLLIMALLCGEWIVRRRTGLR